jgi:hypothetical protein
MEKLNQDLKEVMLLQGQNGGHRYPNGLTSKTFHNLVLEELSPWIKKDIGNGMMQKLMRFMAGPVAGKHFLVIGWVGGHIFPPGVVTIDQIIFVTKQKGIQEIVLHHLFIGPGLYSD